MKKPRLFLALEVLVTALLLHGAKCQSSRGGGGGGSAANLTVTGTVFCDACSSSSFSNHSYFLPGVKVRIDCMIRVNSTSKEEIRITAEKVTNSYGAYKLDIPAIDGFDCTTGVESFCRAAVLDNPSTLCNVPAVTTTVGHISFSNQESNECLYNLNSLYYRPGKKAAGQCDGMPSSLPAALNTSLFYCPPWPWPPIPFCTPRPWFPPIPFFTRPPPAFPFPLPPLPPMPFFTPPSPPPPAFPFPLPRWPWTPPAAQPPPSWPFPHLPPIFSRPSPPPPPPPAFPFPLPPLPHLPPFPHLPPLRSWYSPPPPPPPPPPPSFPWPFPPLPFFHPTPSPSAPSPPPLKYSRKDPSTWSSSKNQP